MAELRVGVKAPDFTLPTGDGSTISLKDMKGKKVVLYFYPKDDTSGCTKEACSFRDNVKLLEKRGAVVIGVSTDSPESHGKFADKYKLPFTLASDEKKELVKKYGVWKEKSMYGRKYMGTERTTFVIDEDGKIARIFTKVKVDGHVEELLGLIEKGF
jgi:peroxiredoxin Q/BCP